MTDRSLARRALLESAILKELDALNADTRAALSSSGLEPGDRVTVADLGHVLMTNPKPTRRVVDWPALIAWVEQHAPEQIIQPPPQIAPGFIAALTKTGEYISADGEVLVPDGIGTVAGQPRLTVSPSDQATDVARGLLGRMPLEIEP